MHLEKETFQTVITSTPLISIDLVIRNNQRQYLLGYRNNKPAQGYWFVPGGRILKDERKDDAFKRLVLNELGIHLTISDATFHGVYEHFYNDYVFGDDVTTHYVVLAYEVVLNIGLNELPEAQHSQYKWYDEDELLAAEDVHLHSKWYVKERR